MYNVFNYKACSIKCKSFFIYMSTLNEEDCFMSKDQLIKALYSQLSDTTDMADLVSESVFVEITKSVLYDYVLIPEASIIQ